MLRARREVRRSVSKRVYMEERMMNRFTHRSLILLAALAAFSVAPQAEAGMIPVNVSVTPDSGNFRWTYGVVVTTDVAVQPGDFFTVYDFGAMVPGTIVAPPDWTVTTAMVGPTPDGTHPADDPNIANITFTYTGGSAVNGQVGLGNFSAISTFGDSTTSDFTSITHRQVDGRSEANITSTDVPVPGDLVSNSPEPATLALCGFGLPLAGLVNWLRRRRQVV
jgi:hypothetical protein